MAFGSYGKSKGKDDFSFTIHKDFGALTPDKTHVNDWEKHLVLISFNDETEESAVFAIYKFNKDFSKLSKSATMSSEELQALYEIIRDKIAEA